MQVEIKNRHLVELYEKGESKKYRLQPEIIKKFIMRIQQLEAAHTIHDLRKTSSLNFEKMQGTENSFSVRLNKKWRLEMDIEWEDDKQTRGKITVTELSKHYGD